MVDETKDASVEFIRSITQQITLLANSPKKRGINWNNAVFYGAISTGILLTCVGMAIDNWRNYNAGYEAGASSTKTKIEVECYHHQIRPGETINDVLSYFRTKDYSVTREKVFFQNGLLGSLRPGEDITYCFYK